MICVAIANDNINDMLKNAKRAIDLGANFIEIRIDYLKNLNFKLIDNLKQLISLSIPVIFTCRKESEGGKNQLKEDFRLHIIEKLIYLKPDYIDLEYNIEKEELIRLFKKAHENQVKIILSIHDFEKTQSLDESWAIIDSMKMLDYDILKIIMMANVVYDNNVILNLIEKARKNDIDIVSFCMGNKGIISRILSPFIGAKFTFASLDISTAPGQISIQEMNTIYKILNNNMK